MREELILFVLPSFGGGGAERVTIAIASELFRSGHAVEIVAATATGPLATSLAPSLSSHDLGSHRMSRALPGLIRLLRQKRPAAVVSTLDHANLLVATACRLAGTRSVARLANTTGAALRGRRASARLAWRAALSVGYRLADARIAVSRGVAQDMAELTGIPVERFTVVHNPVDVERVREAARQPARHPWLVDGAPPVILAVGRLEEQKDFPTLVRAFARLREKRPIRLLVLGEGSQRAKLADLVADLGIGDDVQLPGFLPDPYPEMARAAVFCLSSRYEGFPNVLVEALACGTPVVSTRCPSGPDEILDGEGSRWLVPVGDDRALAASLEQRLEARRDEASQLAIARRFDLPEVAQAYWRIAMGR